MSSIKAAPALVEAWHKKKRDRIASRPGGKLEAHAGAPFEHPRTPNEDRLGSTVNMFSGREPWFRPFTVDIQPMVSRRLGGCLYSFGIIRQGVRRRVNAKLKKVILFLPE